MEYRLASHFARAKERIQIQKLEPGQVPEPLFEIRVSDTDKLSVRYSTESRSLATLSASCIALDPSHTPMSSPLRWSLTTREERPGEADRETGNESVQVTDSDLGFSIGRWRRDPRDPAVWGFFSRKRKLVSLDTKSLKLHVYTDRLPQLQRVDVLAAQKRARRTSANVPSLPKERNFSIFHTHQRRHSMIDPGDPLSRMPLSPQDIPFSTSGSSGRAWSTPNSPLLASSRRSRSLCSSFLSVGSASRRKWGSSSSTSSSHSDTLCSTAPDLYTPTYSDCLLFSALSLLAHIKSPEFTRLLQSAPGCNGQQLRMRLKRVSGVVSSGFRFGKPASKPLGDIFHPHKPILVT